MVIVMMGPAGAGKSTVGAALAARLGWRFVDADDFHSASNVARMARGEALTDGDRAGWLSTLHDVLAQASDRRESLVLACSALTAAHRAHLVGALRHIRFAYLKSSPAVLRSRLEARTNHFAGSALLDSQLATLEEPGPPAVVFDGEAPVDATLERIRLEYGV
jgi:gluconokinase